MGKEGRRDEAAGGFVGRGYGADGSVFDYVSLDRDHTWRGDSPGAVENSFFRKEDFAGPREKWGLRDAEEYLPGVLAGQIPADFEMEALKAQAVIARTYIYKQMEKNEDGIWQVPESALDLDVLEMPQMKKMWGNEAFLEAYGRLEEAVQATSGQVLKWQEAYIDPMFCRASAGMTRQGDENHPYLQPVDCPGDLEAEGYLQLVNFSKGEFADRLSQIPGGDGETVPAVEAASGLHSDCRAGGGRIRDKPPGWRTDFYRGGGAVRSGTSVQRFFFRAI